MTHTFDHEKMDVYRVAIELVAVAEETAVALPRGRTYLRDQLRRAASSVALNVAEGAGEFASGDKARFYRMARRSATETGAVIDVCRILHIGNEDGLEKGRALLLRIVALLTALILKVSRRGGGGSGPEPEPVPEPEPGSF